MLFGMLNQKEKSKYHKMGEFDGISEDKMLMKQLV